MSGSPAPAEAKRVSRRRAIATASATATALFAGCRALPFGETVRTGHLFVENQEDDPFEIAVSVIEATGGGDRPVNALYRVPGSTVLQFREVLSVDATYAIRAMQPAIGPEAATNLDVTIDTCEPNDPAGKTDVGVLASSNGPEIIVYDCHTPYEQTGDLTYVEPSEYRVRELTDTITSPTPA